MEPWAVAAIATVAGTIVAGIGTFGAYRANRSLGIAPGQQALVKTLQDTVHAQGERIELIELEKDECKAELGEAKFSINGLWDANAELKREIHSLHRQLDAWENGQRPAPDPRRRKPGRE
jgi:chromosome segregation ATPase